MENHNSLGHKHLDDKQSHNVLDMFQPILGLMYMYKVHTGWGKVHTGLGKVYTGLGKDHTGLGKVYTGLGRVLQQGHAG